MFYQLFYRLVLILVFVSLYCYASPVPSNDQNQAEQPTVLATENNEQSDIVERLASNTSSERPSTNDLNEIYYLRMLCALYGSCNDDDEQIIDYDDIKNKRLSSSLFHGIPKFDKRAFSSAFAGIPKFG